MPKLPTKPTPKNNSATSADVTRLDFGKLGLPEYRNKFAIIIDNLFSPEDCQRFLRAAELEHTWSEATHSGTTYLKNSVTSPRIIPDPPTPASELFCRLKPYLSSIEHLESSPLHPQFANEVTYLSDPPARMVGFNERLRFLKYSPGQFFRKHCDGNYRDSKSDQISYYTLQLYLNDLAPEQDGSTRFSKPPNSNGGDAGPYIDVQPKLGRALIFEQSGLWHSGQDILQDGEKYTIRAELMYGVIQDGVGVVGDDEIAFE